MPTRQARCLTAQEAKQWFRDNGICVKHWCMAHDVSLDSVNALFRGIGKANSGKSHDAAVKLGMKLDPKILHNPGKPQPLPMPKEAKR